MEGPRLGWFVAGIVAVVAAITLVITAFLEDLPSGAVDDSAANSTVEPVDVAPVASGSSSAETENATSTDPHFRLSQSELKEAEAVAVDAINAYGLYPGPDGEQPILDQVAPYITDGLQRRLQNAWRDSPALGITSTVKDIRLLEAPLHQSPDEVQVEAFVTKIVTYRSSTRTFYPVIVLTVIKDDDKWTVSDINEIGVKLLDN